MWTSTRPAATALDSADALAGLRVRYELPPGLIRLDGNSGGAAPSRTSARLRKFAEHRWMESCARRFAPDWELEARTCAAKLARLIGAGECELTVAETTSVNLFKALVAASRLRPGHSALAVGRDCFASDHYLARSAAAYTGTELLLFDDLAELPFDRVAVVALSHTDVRSGAVRDPVATTAALHEQGVLVLWELSESAGALDVDLHAWNADLAVGCGHRYLGGGPGAPAYWFVAERHQRELGGRDRGCDGVLSQAASGFSGAPSTLALSELRHGLSMLDGVSGAELEAKTGGLVSLFVDRLLRAPGVEIVPPRRGRRRGPQVSLRHPRAQLVVAELFARGVVVDFVDPDLLRFSFAPSWLRYIDVWEAAEVVREVLEQLDRES